MTGRSSSDPYAPPGRVSSPVQGVLPERRLRRLGVGEHVIAWLAATWAAQDDEARREAADDLAVRSDAEVTTMLVEQLPPAGSKQAVLDWVLKSDTPAVAAALAAAIEEAQPKPRVTLLDELAAIGRR